MFKRKFEYFIWRLFHPNGRRPFISMPPKKVSPAAPASPKKATPGQQKPAAPVPDHAASAGGSRQATPVLKRIANKNLVYAWIAAVIILSCALWIAYQSVKGVKQQDTQDASAGNETTPEQQAAPSGTAEPEPTEKAPVVTPEAEKSVNASNDQSA